MTHIVEQRLRPREQPLRFKVGDNSLARLASIQALVRTALGRDLRIFVNDADLGEIVALTHLKVGRIVRRCDFHRTRAEGGIHERVFNYRNLAVQQRQDHGLPLELLVAVVFRVDGDGCISKHGFRPCRGYLNESALAPLQRISDEIEFRVDGFVDRLEIRQGRAASRAPVDQALAPVDQAFII